MAQALIPSSTDAMLTAQADMFRSAVKDGLHNLGYQYENEWAKHPFAGTEELEPGSPSYDFRNTLRSVDAALRSPIRKVVELGRLDEYEEFDDLERTANLGVLLSVFNVNLRTVNAFRMREHEGRPRVRVLGGTFGGRGEITLRPQQNNGKKIARFFLDLEQIGEPL